jgi:hypothetical protein
MTRRPRGRELATTTARASSSLVLLLLAACGTVPHRPERLAHSSYGCMKAVLDTKLPPHLPDNKAHCLASGLIARYCSIPESYLAGVGKEVRDLLGPGDAQWRDLKADWAGVDCARQAESDAALATCCMP